ncbi:hypothetical protein ANN_05678 [Periplaneta americana]|uniref:Uncharacterized protein n=1 Tax=Periplaneta americana TaxID=6978 RepID=A0ABQ8TBG5_PERAM|nr:hypothetical protein ANN_05678 [Periplaneta americana]
MRLETRRRRRPKRRLSQRRHGNESTVRNKGTTATSFGMHVQERAAAAIKASYNIPNITNLSTSTAMTLFKTVVAPVITYGIEIIWEKLKIGDMIRIEKVKTMFMKRILGVGKAAPARLVYELMREAYFVDDIRSQHWLPSTGPYQELVSISDRKKKEIDLEFYTTSAMLDDSWTRECRSQRHHARYAGDHRKAYRPDVRTYPLFSCGVARVVPSVNRHVQGHILHR